MDQTDRKRRWIALSFWKQYGTRVWRDIRERDLDPMLLFDPDFEATGECRDLFEDPPASELGRLLDQADREIHREKSGDHRIVSWDDAAYPNMLRDMPDAPIVLYCRGDPMLLNSLSLAIVGTRHPSSYGFDVTRIFAREVASHGLTVVSGLAIGIDAAAHQQAIDQKGATLAVLGCGLDQDYPASNRVLRSRVEARGLVVSEFVWGTRPKPEQFPRRNRIISGLSMGVIIVEAGIRSGAMSTINHALDLGRDIFAVPGPITSPISKGPLRLIQQGAIPLVDFQDIIDHYPSLSPHAAPPDLPFHTPSQSPPSIDPVLRPLWNLLSALPIQLDQLVVRSGLPVSTIHAALLDFELKGWVRQLPGKMFVLTV